MEINEIEKCLALASVLISEAEYKENLERKVKILEEQVRILSMHFSLYADILNKIKREEQCPEHRWYDSDSHTQRCSMCHKERHILRIALPD